MPGVTLSSFGVGVAEMAGMMPSVLNRAEEVSGQFNASIACIKKRMKKELAKAKKEASQRKKKKC